MARTDRGFASLDLNKRREISSKGGQAAHRQGKAHKWTTEEAREAGRKGGMASHRRRRDGLHEQNLAAAGAIVAMGTGVPYEGKPDDPIHE